MGGEARKPSSRIQFFNLGKKGEKDKTLKLSFHVRPDNHGYNSPNARDELMRTVSSQITHCKYPSPGLKGWETDKCLSIFYRKKNSQQDDKMASLARKPSCLDLNFIRFKIVKFAPKEPPQEPPFLINNRNDPRRPNQIHRHPARSYDDKLAKCLIVLTIVFSLYGLYTKRSWCTWMSLYCACRCFANSPVDNNQGFCCLVFAITAITMSYLQKFLPSFLEFAEYGF
ncbi:Protein Asterix like protein [Argiope bruennichi]|uniref:Protein Asterix like protein n=1 Tax=Argiope bruennichi TaxID=94029 RepID=A0A8T0F7Z0_ARGBR|nr:Protein Asterix like protein [Argiope bruennichi]